MALFENLQLWIDPVARPGTEAMAVDEWLLDQAREPLLRLYHWRGEWGSVGYFGSLQEAAGHFPGLHWVRRWTGGGTVDHRQDWTYTLVIPKGYPLAETRGAESYHRIHECLAKALREMGIPASLSGGDRETGASLCFENPVCHDLVDPWGRKISGAGQRRTSAGLLHQGSVAPGVDPAAELEVFGRMLASQLSLKWTQASHSPAPEWLAEKISTRYGDPGWLKKR